MARAEHNSPPEVPEHTLLRQIGQGAYGEVWLARNALGTYRAAKIIYRSHFDHERPYERELRAIHEVEPFTRQHDGLVDILQVGEREDYFYYIMELADDIGEESELNPETYQPRTLTMELYERERLPVESACAMGVTIAKALAFLHENNLVHRDVKLSNIIYVNGRVKLADVGLVTRSDASFSLVGTYGYIPREGPGRPPADIYALGKVLYEAATGKDRADFPEIDILDPALKDLNRIFLRACAEEPEDRYPSAGGMADELEQLIPNDEAVKVSSTSSSSYKTGALAASLLLILALIFYSRDTKPDLAEAPPPKPASPVARGKPDSGSEQPAHPLGATNLNEGLVAYYPFNGNAKDESGNGNDGDVKGAALIPDRHGKKDSAYGFDGQSSNIQIERTASIKKLENSEKEFSIVLWVNLKEFLSGGSLIRHDCEFNLYATPSGVAAEKFFENQNSFRITSTLEPLTLHTWVSVCCVFRMDGEEIYIDGVKQRTSSDQQVFPEGMFNNPLTIGKSLRHHDPSNGAIDDIRIYSRALSTEEVKALYDLEKPKLAPYKVDAHTVLLEHFEGATLGKPNRQIVFAQGRVGQGIRMTPETFVCWEKGPVPEGTFEFWFKADEDKFTADLASANFSNLPAAITVRFAATSERGLYAELFAGQTWRRPPHVENKIRPGRWNHAAISWGRNGVRTYLNGTQIAYLEGEHYLNPSTGTWVIGAQIRAIGVGFAGVIDEVRISRVQRKFNPANFRP
jgi:serine/threonine protein kinase